MNAISSVFTKRIFVLSAFMCMIGAVLYSIGLTFFVVPVGAYAGGVNGLSQILQQVMEQVGLPKIPLGLISICFNIPILIFGWLKVDRRFTVLTIVSVLSIGFFLNIFATMNVPVLTDEILLNVMFGGLLMGVGTGITLRSGGSTGGTDVFLAYLSQKTGKSFGGYSIMMNSVIVLLAFMLDPQNVERILITIVLFFIISLVINQVHTKHKRFTVFIISSDPTSVVEQIHLRCGRGATMYEAEGTYQRTTKTVIMTVITSYQLYVIKDIIEKYDPEAFVNIVDTAEIYGNFTNSKTDIPLN